MDMDKYIQSLIDSGMTLDEVGRELSCALNRKQKELDEADLFDRHRDGLIDNINAAIDINNFDFKAAASAATLAMIDGDYIRNKADAERFFTQIHNALERDPGTPHVCNCNKSRVEGDKVLEKVLESDDFQKVCKFLRALGL